MNTSESNQFSFRSIDELEDTPEFQEFLTREFPKGVDEPPDGLSRRRWLHLMGASAVLASVSGCRFENKKITPYTFRPEDRIPGTTRTFATTIEWAGGVRPLYVTSYDSRPIKADGNPLHPECGGSARNRAPKGSSDLISQAAVLDLYDPDRSRSCLEKVGRSFAPRNWSDFSGAVQGLELLGNQGKGLTVLSEPTTSQTVQRLKKNLLEKLPQAKWFEYSPISDDHEQAGLKSAFGKSLRAQHNLENAEVVLCLDADPLRYHRSALKLSKAWAKSRIPDVAVMAGRPISRLYCVESQFSLTGVNADHRWPMKSSAIASFAEALRQQVDIAREKGQMLDVEGTVDEQRLAVLANELVFGTTQKAGSQGRTVVIAGAHQPPVVHHLAAVLNDAIGSKLVSYTAIPESTSNISSIKEAVAELNSGNTEHLLMIGGNPVFDAPSDLKFKSALSSVKNKIHFSVSRNETTDECSWHANMGHPFEVWSDSVASDGSVGIGQPMIEPLFGAKSTAELLATVIGVSADGLELVRETYVDLSDEAWNQTVHNGFIANSFASSVAVGAPTAVAPGDSTTWMSPSEAIELVFTNSNLYDGRLSNNGWLQEVPDSVTKVAWDNPVMINPKTAKLIGAKQNEKITIEVDGDTIEAPVFIQPGQAENSISIAIGYGRRKVGHVGGSIEKNLPPVGIDVSSVRKSNHWNIVDDVKASGTGSRYRLSSTQDHHAIDLTGKAEIGNRWDRLIYEDTFDSYKKFAKKVIGRDDSSSASKGDTIQDFFADEEEIPEKEERPHWPGHHHLHFENVEMIRRSWDYSKEAKWGMSIDLAKCTGCSACVVACQAENNIAIVGKDQVSRGRELHWMRIDRYLVSHRSYQDAGRILEDPEPIVRTQPVTCHHCENAPCEQVCPVAATVHSDEGLNDMVYNRCIGTRYCGNNCPYKVRRFNYLNYSNATTFVKYPWADTLSQSDIAVESLAMNPEVTIRSRGVMEKCTYCVQRIQNTKIKAKTEGREVGGNEITTACQDCCPTGAIVFGNLADPASQVSTEQIDVRAYVLLDELNLGQRTKYLASIINPNPSWPVLTLNAAGETVVQPYEKAFPEKGHHEKHSDEKHGDEKHGDEKHGDEKHGDEKHGDEKHADEKHADEDGEEKHGKDEK